ncbi:GNAT family N-acetyltransferase [Roseibium sp. SCP14]|uniref:GNAT family N-acetyltransferase n=1 Tax=Roseibium sp. SCP14 TaxID=3141375 RepID=UPI003338332B
MLPTFDTRRLRVRPRSHADLDQCLSMDRDPLVTQFIPGPWSEPDKHRAFVLNRMDQQYPDGLGYWSVVRKDEPEIFLGWILLLPYEAVSDEIEIGWRFSRRSWGHGYATEAASAVLDHAFCSLKLDYVVADIHPENFASIRVAEKTGMTFVENRTFGSEPARSFRAFAKDYL